VLSHDHRIAERPIERIGESRKSGGRESGEKRAVAESGGTESGESSLRAGA
jgi:hypothetical protein